MLTPRGGWRMVETLRQLGAMFLFPPANPAAVGAGGGPSRGSARCWRIAEGRQYKARRGEARRRLLIRRSR